MDCTRSHASITAYVNFRTCTYFFPKKKMTQRQFIIILLMFVTIFCASGQFFELLSVFVCLLLTHFSIDFFHILFLYYFLYILYFLLYFIVLIILFCSSFTTFLMITTIFLYTYCYKYLLFYVNQNFSLYIWLHLCLYTKNGFYNHLI